MCDYERYYYYYGGGMFEKPTKEETSGTKEVELSKGDIYEMPTGEFWSAWALLGKTYEYPRIQSVSQFFAEEGHEMTEEAKNAIGDQEWILRFYESNYTYTNNTLTGLYHEDRTKVTAIRLFRLVYEYDGKIYDVGVIADQVGEDDVAGGYGVPPEDNENEKWFQKLLAVLLFVLLIVVIIALFPIIAPIFKFALLGLFHILSALWTILTYPFILIFKNAFK